MGNPIHYSLELPERCLQLIDELWPRVEQISQPDHPELGPLTTTFLLSMATPIITLPIERLERYRDNVASGYANDRSLDPKLSSEIDSVLGANLFKNTPFFQTHSWSYVKWDDPKLNLGSHIPAELTTKLKSAKAIKDAERLQASQWCSIIRNALSHGGIAYLDASGDAATHGPAAVYCFVSGKYENGDKDPIYLNCLRITETNFRSFLKNWVGWLKRSSLSRLMAA
jgi:hypothetical protein